MSKVPHPRPQIPCVQSDAQPLSERKLNRAPVPGQNGCLALIDQFMCEQNECPVEVVRIWAWLFFPGMQGIRHRLLQLPKFNS